MGSSAVRLRIDRAAGSGSFVSIAYIIPAEGGYHDPYVNAGTTYTYRIIAENAAGSSVASNSAAAVAPAAAQGEAGMPPLPADVPDSTLDGSWIGGFYADGEVISAGWNGGPGGPLADVSEAQAKINADGFSQEIQVVPAPNSHLALLHVYKVSKWFGGSVYIGSYTFDPKDTNDTDAKIAAAENSANIGRINSGATATAQVLVIGTAVAGVFIPGPDDIILGAVIEQAVKVLGKAGVKAICKGGTWIFEKVGGKVLAGGEAIAQKEALRETVLAELGGGEVTWATEKEYPRHLPPKGVAWNSAVKSTRHGPAKYMPGIDIEMLEREVHRFGLQSTKPGKTRWRVMQFNSVIGASEGKEVKWVRVEETGGPDSLVIHGHPITEKEYKDLIKAR
jgi:peptidoglycan hydrolase-like protein with peptidoglycan-binding domain